MAQPSAATYCGMSSSATLTSVLISSSMALTRLPQRKMPPTRVTSLSILMRFKSCTERWVSDMPAPNMMSSGGTLLERWLMTSDSANTVQTPEIGTASLARSKRSPMSTVS